MHYFNTIIKAETILQTTFIKWIFLNANLWISTKISLKFVTTGPNNNIPALVQLMAWHRPGDKPLTEPMIVRLLMHICWLHGQGHRVNQCSELYFLQCCLKSSWVACDDSGFDSLRHWGWDKMSNMFVMIETLNAYGTTELLLFWFVFHWELFCGV